MKRFLIEFRDGTFSVVRASDVTYSSGEWAFWGAGTGGAAWLCMDADADPDFHGHDPGDGDILFVEEIDRTRTDLRAILDEDAAAERAAAVERALGRKPN